MSPEKSKNTKAKQVGGWLRRPSDNGLSWLSPGMSMAEETGENTEGSAGWELSRRFGLRFVPGAGRRGRLVRCADEGEGFEYDVYQGDAYRNSRRYVDVILFKKSKFFK